MLSKPVNILPLIILICAACSSRPEFVPNDGLDGFSTDQYVEYVKKLSSDEFLGRKPFTEGETKALAYLQKQFKKIGLEPGNGDSYLQDVPLVSITTMADPTMTVKSSTGNLTLKGFDDYVIWTSRMEKEVDLKDDELVFAGFGVQAPEYGWDDFHGVDVKGKIILVLVNDPGFGSDDTTFFKGKTMTYYGRWTYKFEEAARLGAKGCLVIHDTAPASYGFQVLQNNWNTSNLYLASDAYRCPVVGWVSNPTAHALFKAAGMDYDTKLKEAHRPAFQAQPMHLKLTTSMKVEVKEDKSHNVIGKIQGSKRPDEVIIYSAHWDHLGVGSPNDQGDSIYNGALDNASGVAAIMEMARAFKDMKNPPERSIVFLALTAEEQGLLGSEYYASHPVYPLEKTVANINIDVVNNIGKTKDFILIGKGQSELEDILNVEAKREGRYIAPETTPEAGHYFRSDHFSFAKAGVPALDTEGGVDLVGQGKEEGERLEKDYVDHYYHQPSDEYDSTRWKLDGAIDDMQLLFQVGKRLSFQTTWPKWKPGSEFKAIRESYMPKIEN